MSRFDTVSDAPDTLRQPRARQRLSVVVPCYNEVESIGVLADGLARLREALIPQYETEIVLVDDGSSDATWQVLADEFGHEEDVRRVRHEQNQGIAAAIATGIRAASAEIVASLDADCTYDPLQICQLLERLTDGVDMVVASPYHPAGRVEGVPPWRLTLSRLASRLYALVMRNQLHTYTSCVRVYRRSSVVDLPQSERGFVGIVELLWQLDRRGGRIAECPAVLTVRKTGHSKMKLARTTCVHLSFLARAVLSRPFSPAERAPARNTTQSHTGLAESSALHFRAAGQSGGATTVYETTT
jgi:dolichol-phosphate mannosyltransferase